MNCKKCGNPLVEGDLVCRNCGEPVTVDATMSQQSVVGVQQPVQGVGAQPVQQPTINSEQVVQNVVASQTEQVIPGIVQQPSQEVVQPVVEGVQQPIQQPVPGIVEPQSQGVNQGIQQPVPGIVQQPSQEMVQPIADGGIQQSIPGGVQQAQNNVLSQQQVFEQQMAQQPMQQQSAQVMPTQPQPKKEGKNSIFIIIILLCLVAIGVLVYFVFFNKGVGASNNADTTPSTVSNEETTTNTNDGSTTVANNENQVEVSGYTVTLPDGFQHQYEDDKLLIVDSNKTMVVSFVFYSYSIDEIKNNISTLEAEFKKEVGDVAYSTVTSKNMEFLNFRYVLNEFNVNSFFVKFNDKEIVQGSILEGQGFDSKTAFDYVADIINSATGEGKTSSFSVGVPKLDMNNAFFQEIKKQ